MFKSVSAVFRTVEHSALGLFYKVTLPGFICHSLFINNLSGSLQFVVLFAVKAAEFKMRTYPQRRCIHVIFICI